MFRSKELEGKHVWMCLLRLPAPQMSLVPFPLLELCSSILEIKKLKLNQCIFAAEIPHKFSQNEELRGTSAKYQAPWRWAPPMSLHFTELLQEQICSSAQVLPERETTIYTEKIHFSKPCAYLVISFVKFHFSPQNFA